MQAIIVTPLTLLSVILLVRHTWDTFSLDNEANVCVDWALFLKRTSDPMKLDNTFNILGVQEN